jgi:hypothetical protein
MVLEEAAAGFLYSLKKQRSAACEAQPAKRSLRSKAGQSVCVTYFLESLSIYLV